MTTTNITVHHQARDRAVPCRDCRGTTFNAHVICNRCLDAGAPIDCFGICAETVRSTAARTQPQRAA